MCLEFHKLELTLSRVVLQAETFAKGIQFILIKYFAEQQHPLDRIILL